MEYLSTTSLAHELDIQVNEMFTNLHGLGWIERSKDKWVLTNEGKAKGGKTKSDPKFGEYIVWPENIALPNTSVNKKDGLLNPTAIGQHFKISSQKVNLILSELGFIESDAAGWELTRLGKKIGGKQCKHEQSGKLYVLWPGSIVTNKDLLDVLAPAQTPPTEKSLNPSTVTAENFRKNYPANFRTQDGHFVRSKSEVMIDDFLYFHGLIHSYEKKLPVLEDVICDFYIPPSGVARPKAVYIEYWGLENDPKYQERKQRKLQVYRENEFLLIELNDSDLQNLDDVLTRKLLEFKIKVG